MPRCHGASGIRAKFPNWSATRQKNTGVSSPACASNILLARHAPVFMRRCAAAFGTNYSQAERRGCEPVSVAALWLPAQGGPHVNAYADFGLLAAGTFSSLRARLRAGRGTATFLALAIPGIATWSSRNWTSLAGTR